MSEKSFKDSLLKSGIPLEFEVFNLLSERGLFSDFEYSYLKNDEQKIEKEFSYDIDASLIGGLDFTEFMVECKYKVDNTKWIFIPEVWGGPHELYPLDFIHTIDHFSKKKSRVFNDYRYPIIGPPCNKGVELYGNGQSNEKTIEQAIFQISSAFSEKIVSAFEHQIDELLVKETVFNLVPTIVTNAQLLRLNPEVTIEKIRSSNDITDFASTHEIVIMKTRRSPASKKENYIKILSYLSRVPKKKIKERFRTFTNSLPFLAEILSDYPKAIAIVNWDAEGKNLNNYVSYVESAINPSIDILQKIANEKEASHKRIEEMKKKVKERTNSNLTTAST